MFKERRVYLYKDGIFQETNFGGRTPTKFDLACNNIRHKRRLMLELRKRGDMFLYFGEDIICLSNEQIESIIRFRKDNKELKMRLNLDD